MTERDDPAFAVVAPSVIKIQSKAGKDFSCIFKGKTAFGQTAVTLRSVKHDLHQLNVPTKIQDATVFAQM